jgi:hypothetical protein
MMEAQVSARDVFIVLDIETAPPRSSPTPILLGSRDRTSVSHEITAVAMLVAGRASGPTWTIDSLHSWDRSRHSEFDILLGLNRKLVGLLSAGATLITFNGIRHDVPGIRRRAAFHRMFELSAWESLLSCHHRDLMIDGMSGPHAQWSSLRDICQALYIPTDSNFAKAAQATVDAARRKCETDVCSTFALLLYTLALEAADEKELIHGWHALADHMRVEHAQRPHLVQFAYAVEDLSI